MDSRSIKGSKVAILALTLVATLCSCDGVEPSHTSISQCASNEAGPGLKYIEQHKCYGISWTIPSAIARYTQPASSQTELWIDFHRYLSTELKLSYGQDDAYVFRAILWPTRSFLDFKRSEASKFRVERIERDGRSYDIYPWGTGTILGRRSGRATKFTRPYYVESKQEGLFGYCTPVPAATYSELAPFSATLCKWLFEFDQNSTLGLVMAGRYKGAELREAHDFVATLIKKER